MSTAPVVPSATSTTPPPTTNGLPSGQSLNNMFLQLLVAQLQNQNPDNPVDGTTFITQLAQFSELSNSTQELANTTAMATDLSSIQQELAPPAAATPTATPPAASIPTLFADVAQAKLAMRCCGTGT